MRRARYRMRVLVADDEPAIRMLIVDTLEDAGFDVMTARSGDEALRLIVDPDHFDILITDINMPGADGLAVARGARARNPDVPVLFVSGRIDILKTSISVPVPHRYLAKPFSLLALSLLVGDMAREIRIA